MTPTDKTTWQKRIRTENSSLLPSLFRGDFFCGLLLVLATIVAYRQAWHAGFIWDDDRYVTQNKLLTAPDGRSEEHTSELQSQ